MSMSSGGCTFTPRPCSAALLILSFLVPAPALLLSGPAAVPSLRASVSRHPAVPGLRASVLLSAPSGDAEGNDDELSDAPMMEELRCRMREVQANDALLSRLGSIPHAFVLVFDPDTEDEAVYSIELPPDEAEAEASRKPVHSVVAFEDEEEAKAYAASVIHELEEGEPSIQALDLEALVVSSREAHFRVALVLRGDLLPAGPGAAASAGELLSPYISMGVPPPPPPLAVSFTMVPDELYADRRAEGPRCGTRVLGTLASALEDTLARLSSAASQSHSLRPTARVFPFVVTVSSRTATGGGLPRPA